MPGRNVVLRDSWEDIVRSEKVVLVQESMQLMADQIHQTLEDNDREGG